MARLNGADGRYASYTTVPPLVTFQRTSTNHGVGTARSERRCIMPTFSDIRPPSRLSKRFTKQIFYIRGIAVKIRKIWSTWLGSTGPRCHLRGVLDCAMLYRVAIDALQTRIISRCNETYHLTTRQRRSVHRINDFISRRRRYLNDLSYDILSLPQTREVSSPWRKRDTLGKKLW